MSVLDLLGRESGAVRFDWDEHDVRLYALGVGAASADPLGDELRFVSPGTPDRPVQVLPSFAVLPGSAARRSLDLRELPRASVVHASQSVELVRPVPPRGRVETVCRVVGVWDKGSGALVDTEAVSVDAVTGEPLFVNRSSSFARGLGGFGGERGPSSAAGAPEREPDAVASVPTREDQALLYALSGDDNPLHWDPAFARRAGFDRPILHGLATFGVAARALTALVCGGDPALLRSISARFTAPVLPGRTLQVAVWSDRDGRGASFRVLDGSTVVLDHGHCALRTPLDDAGTVAVGIEARPDRSEARP